MCRRVECGSCGKPTYAGCGAHIEQVLQGVPVAKRCSCREEKAAQKAQSAASTDPNEKKSWLQSLFGK